MCRWLAYSGSPLLIEDILYRPAHSLIAQSLHSTLGAETTNGDGFGIGWYTGGDAPGVFRSIEPAWNDRNLRELAGHITSPVLFAHIRASSGSAIQQTNCHPFRHGRWLWMHNGVVREFAQVKRDLVLAVDASLYPHIEGSTDSEIFFFLALTLGLEDDPPGAVARAVGLIEEIGRAHGVEHPIQMTVATTDGKSVWAFRYSSERDSRSLFYSTDVPTLRKAHPELRGARPAERRVPPDRVGAAAGSPRGMERSAGVELRRHPGRRRRATPVHAAGSVQAVGRRFVDLGLDGLERRSYADVLGALAAVTDRPPVVAGPPERWKLVHPLAFGALLATIERVLHPESSSVSHSRCSSRTAANPPHPADERSYLRALQRFLLGALITGTLISGLDVPSIV